MMDWVGINEFVLVAQTQSFTKAAEKLGVSVVFVSRKVKALENRLGVKLFKRTTRKVFLTEIGQQYFNDCKPLVEALALAELNVKNKQQTLSGLIKVTAPVTFGERHIAPLINVFLKQNPNIEIELILTNQTLDLMDSGIDIAIRLGNLKDSNLIAKKLASRQMFVCASPAYLNQHGIPHSLSELASHQCLVGSNEYWRFLKNDKVINTRINGRLRCNSGNSLFKAAIDGLGLVQLPDYYVNDALENGQLKEVLPQFRGQEEGIWAVYVDKQILPTKVTKLISFIAQHLK